jgi:hypothetical protein
MRHLTFISVAVALAMLAVCSLLTAGVARAETIISDTFTADDGTPLNGWTPDTANLPGGSWVQQGGWWYDPTIQSGTAELDTDRGASVSMASNGGYVKPTQFTISASLHVGNVAAADGDIHVRGVGLGFYANQDGGENGFTNFCGVYLQPDGSLAYADSWESGAQLTSTAYLPYQGSWDAGVWHTLSYNVDTTTGTISNVVLDGTGYTFAGGDAVFTDGQTTAAGIVVSDSNGDGIGHVDDFNVSTAPVPEPGTLALLAAGLAGLLCYAWRKRR